MNNHLPNQVLKPLSHQVLFAFIVFIAYFSFSSSAISYFEFALAGIMLLWTIFYSLERQYSLTSIPFLFLVFGTFSLGKAFSVIHLGAETLPLYVTELAIAAALGLLLYGEKKPLKIWKNWTERLPKYMGWSLLFYIALGTVYLVFGFKANGGAAFRDVVICHYAVLLFLTLSVLESGEKIRSLLFYITPAVMLIVWVNFRIHYLYKPLKAVLREFVSISKATNFTLYFGLLFIFGLCLLPLQSKKMKWVTRVLLFLSLLFIIAWESRTAWAGLIVALLFLVFFLKKELLVVLLIILLMIPTLYLIDYFELGIRNNKLSTLEDGISSIGKKTDYSTKAANIKFRLNLWAQTWEKIKQRPLFGWGFGVQIDYKIWRHRLSELKAMGASNGIMPAHNHLVAITHKMGFVGLVLFLLLNVQVFLYGLLYLKRCLSTLYRRLLMACLAGMVYWHGMAFFFDILESPPTGIFLWILLGFILALVYADKHSGVRVRT